MKKNEEKQTDKKLSLTNPSTLDLRGRQSVRATFRLSEDCIGAISVLSAQLGIKQKSVFDHLMEDAQVLKDMARELSKTEMERHKRIPKTFVISRRSLSFLDKISSEYETPRDALVEYSVRRLLPIIEKERKKHEARKKILIEITHHFANGEELLSKANTRLDDDDPVVIKLGAVISAYQHAIDEIANFVAKGKILEEFQPD